MKPVHDDGTAYKWTGMVLLFHRKKGLHVVVDVIDASPEWLRQLMRLPQTKETEDESAYHWFFSMRCVARTAGGHQRGRLCTSQYNRASL